MQFLYTAKLTLTNIIITRLTKYIVAVVGNTAKGIINIDRSEEHTSELQSQ